MVTRRPDAIVAELPPAALRAEVDALPASQQLVAGGQFRVYCARASQIPSVLREIGRLRELTFRAVGEGTGRCVDLDQFDAHYLHLFVWDARAPAIVGAYRLGLIDKILGRYGRRGLYTHSLFRYRARMLDRLKPGMELGRSFVRPEYQRGFAPLLLLWRGIGRFVGRAPQYAVLLGAVSISTRYAAASRRLMVAYLSTHNAEPFLAAEVTPRHPYRDDTQLPEDQPEVDDLRNIEDLSRRVAGIEDDHKGVPVLLRQYLRLGGRLLGFNVDRNFGDALDGLLLVDLRKTHPGLLARYMGEAGSAAFRTYHAGSYFPEPRVRMPDSSAGRATDCYTVQLSR
jgi:putative hemolysin